MFRRSIIVSILASFIIAAGSLLVSAQTTSPVSGKVELVKADGTREPVAGALIEVYRTDIRSGYPSTKTNKKGEFYFAGFILGAEYALSASAPNANPEIRTGIKAGAENVVITMSPGDGRKWTEAEVRGAVASGSSGSGSSGGDGGLTAEEKQQMAEIEKKNAEIIAKNKKIEEGDAIARESGKAGFDALKADNFDVAISKFSEGIAAVPDFVGSTPILINGKMNALKGKGFKLYREGATQTEIAQRRAKYDEANRLFDEALSDFKTAMNILQTADAPGETAETTRRATIKNNLYATAIEIHRLKAATQIDTSKISDAKTVITEYLAFETDAAKKVNAQMVLGDIMRSAGDFPEAIATYRAVLEVKPDHPEAMASLGLSLVAEGAAETPENRDKMQEGLNYMQKYTEIAPVSATDSAQTKELKESVKATVDYLKSEKMVPQKVTTPKGTTKKRG